jgi:hypothetical protein
MASFYAELQVTGATYPVWHCAYEFTQATSERGRVTARVRHGLVRLTLDVPDDDQLLDWAATPYKLLAGYVIFYDAKGGPALETLSWEEGQCVGYQEEFSSGNQQQGAYVCHLTIAARKLTLQPGGPAAYVDPTPGEHGSPTQALLNPLPLIVSPVTPPVQELVLPTVEEVAAVVGEKALEGLAAAAAVAALPLALTLALLLGSTTPAQAPGIPQPHLPPVDPNLLRLNMLAAKHAAGTLTREEEAELIGLLAKVKGIHVQKLMDLKTVSTDFVGKVPMEESDLGRMALKHRIENGIWHDGNIAVFEYEDNDGKVQHLVQGTLPTTKKHAERLALEKLAAAKIPAKNIKRIYSELEPCEVESGGMRGEGCKLMLNSYFPAAKVTYSYDYGGRFTDTKPGRTASLEKRAADFAKYKSLKP